MFLVKLQKKSLLSRRDLEKVSFEFVQIVVLRLFFLVVDLGKLVKEKGPKRNFFWDLLSY